MGRTRRVMVVDDNPLFTETLAAVLEGRGFDVARCHSGRECLETVAHFRPDVIVSDYDMGDLDGLALLARLRGEPGSSRIPFVVVTAVASPSLREQFKTAGAHACFSKFEASDPLLDTLDRLLRGGRDPQEERTA